MKWLWKNRVFPVCLVFAFMFVAISAEAAYAGGRKTTPVKVKLEKPVPVNTMIIKKRDIPFEVNSVGRLYPNRQVTISAQVPGVISRYLVDQGDRVNKGQVLVRLDTSDYDLAKREAQANLTAVQAQLDSAESAYLRAKNLLPRKVISKDNFEKAEAQYKAAKAQMARAQVGVQAAEERLKKTNISAPFGGLISRRHIEIGQMVGAGVPLMTIVDLSRVRVTIHLTERDYVHLDKTDPVTVLVEAYPKATFKGRIDRIGIVADSATNTFPVEILVENRSVKLKPGLSARVSMTTRVVKGVIMIPQSAVLFREKGPEIYIKTAGNQAQIRRVETGLVKNGSIEIKNGLKAGEALIIKGQNYLKPGSRVIVQDR